MCGRYTLITNQEFFSRFSLEDKYRLAPRYDARPGAELPIIVGDKSPELLIKKWGFTAPWSEKQLIFNARVESLSQKPLYHNLLSQQRCFVPVSGFFENRHYFFSKDSYFSLAGLYRDDSFTIITTEPNGIVRPYHHRMPLVLDKLSENYWLSENNYLSVLQASPQIDLHA